MSIEHKCRSHIKHRGYECSLEVKKRTEQLSITLSSYRGVRRKNEWKEILSL
jgi:hypothetical protein